MVQQKKKEEKMTVFQQRDLGTSTPKDILKLLDACTYVKWIRYDFDKQSEMNSLCNYKKMKEDKYAWILQDSTSSMEHVNIYIY